MNAKKSTFMFVVVAITILALVAFPSSAYANHSWNGYHWARTSNPFTIKLGDNVSGSWDSMLRTASSDWSKSNVMDTTVVAGVQDRRIVVLPADVLKSAMLPMATRAGWAWHRFGLPAAYISHREQ